MGISFHNPGAFLIGGILTAVVCLIAYMSRRKPDSSSAVRAANTQRLKEHPLYKRKLLEAKIFRVLSVAGIIIALVASVFLTARPFKRETVKDTVNRRDVFLCIDLSSSNYLGVKELVEAFKETVSGLDGDRIGISLFNTSSIQYVPMTDDYDFALSRLDSLAEYLAAQEEFMTKYAQKYNSVYDIPESERARYEELNRILAAFDSGVTAGYELKGTSAIGEGLASCLFSFPELNEEERTRIIIFLTDNRPELLDAPLVSLQESAQMCAYDNVIVFGIDPADEQVLAASGQNTEGFAESIEEMRSAVESTGGKFYGPDTTLTADQILEDINSIEKTVTRTATSTVDTDIPAFWFYVLAAGVVLIALTTLFYVLRRGLRKGKLSRKVTALVLLLAMAAGVTAVGIRPMYLSPTAEIRTNNLDVAFVVDTTISMWAEDHKGGKRMEGVQKDIQAIMDALPGSNFSLIRFDNGAQILTPYTQDITAISDIVKHLDMPSYATSQGSSLNTAYGALQMMVQSAANKKGSRRTIVFLFSDGETTDGSTLMSFRDLSSLVAGGAVLGYGTANGGAMYYPGRGYVKNVSTGQKALSRIDETTLRQISDDLDVAYINQTTDAGTSLAARLQSIRLMSREVAFTSGDRSGYVETYHYFSAVVGLLLLIWLYLTIKRGGVA